MRLKKFGAEWRKCLEQIGEKVWSWEAKRDAKLFLWKVLWKGRESNFINEECRPFLYVKFAINHMTRSITQKSSFLLHYLFVWYYVTHVFNRWCNRIIMIFLFELKIFKMPSMYGAAANQKINLSRWLFNIKYNNLKGSLLLIFNYMA